MASDKLIRLTYASTSATSDRGGGTAVDPEIGRILRDCKKNNPKYEVGGVLHYGYGYFFQVLEGPQQAVEALYDKIAKDSRHTDVKTLENKAISERNFPDWSMKYVPMEDEIEQVIKRHGMSRFNPYEFGSQAIEDMIGVLVGRPAPQQQPDQDYPRKGVTGFFKRLLGLGGKGKAA